MKKQIFSMISAAMIVACVFFAAPGSQALAKSPEPFHWEMPWEGISFECEGFQIYEKYFEVGEGLTHFDNDGRALRSWMKIKGESVLTKVGGNPDVKLFNTASYSGNFLYDETGYWYASEGGGISWKITATEPGYGVLLINAGHAAIIWDTGEWLHLTPNWLTSPDEVKAVCDYFASH